MFRKVNYKYEPIGSVETYEAECIEVQMRKVVENKEPITNTVPLIYTPKEDGVLPQYDIRTDRWDVALKATDKINATLMAKKDDKPTQIKPDTQTTETNKTQETA